MSRGRRAALAAGAALLLAGVVAPAGSGHFRTDQGQWLYRYYTRDAGPGACDTSARASWVDPLNVLFAPFGGAANADAHIRTDSGFGDTVFNGDQDACGADSRNAPGRYAVEIRNAHWQADGTGLSRYHLRIFPINHPHAAVRDRVSFMDVHHEHLTLAGDHVIDDDWENAESFLVLALAAHHTVAVDELDHGAAGMFRGFFDDGLVSRIGGLHDGVYDPHPGASMGRRLVANERAWFDSRSGAFRVADADGTAVYDGRAYARRTRSGTSYVRIGSRRFLGRLTTLASSAREPHGGRTAAGSAPAVERGDARRRRLFSVGLDGATDVDRELAPGEPTRLGLRAYWLGPSFGRLRAAAAVDHWRVRSAVERVAGVPRAAEAAAHVVVYERSDAVGRALVPGAAPPAGELQVVSLPRASALARQKLVAARSWPRRWVVVASGEPALAVPLRYEAETEGFELMTAGTLVTVVGDVAARDIPRVASRLRPL